MDFLHKTGLENIYKYDDFEKRRVVLRDGRDAFVWFSLIDGHGILDTEFWENPEFYSEDYREEFSANLDSFTSPEEHLRIYEKINKRQFKQFRKLVNQKTKFLEIGSSFGGVIKHVDSIRPERCDALEPNKKDVSFLKSKLENTNVINSLFENYEFESKYDLVVSFEVLEHVFNLTKFLTKLSNITESGARVNFEVPNHRDALLVNYKNERYQSFYYHKSHVHYFTPESLKMIFSNFGFDGEVSSFQMYPFYNQIFWSYNNQPQKNAIDALNYPKLRNDDTVNRKINKFLKKTNKQYYKLVNDNLCGDCLIYKGKRL
jgi:2-polyprenyl-3-methyl-5-hydroxy-6-metoxy-1,4-benzoquinol methylase